MNNNEKLIETLNDLVKINHDRIEGYEKAASQLESVDVDLKALFLKLAGDSEDYAGELKSRIVSLGGEYADDTTIQGKIYRGWMDVKNLFTGSDRKSILESCEFGEDAAQRAYDEALETDADLNVEIRQLIMEQKNLLKNGHDTVKKFRDLQKAVS